MNLDNTPQREAPNTRQTRRHALRAIAGVVVITVAVGTAGARNHVTEIDGPTVIDEPGDYVLTAISTVETVRLSKLKPIE